MSEERPDSGLQAGDPLAVFERWYDEASQGGAPFADAFALATVGAGGQPSVRYVLYKGRTGEALAFVTNFESRKARELEANPRAAIAFFWPSLGRQVRMEGTVTRAPDAASDRYFAARDRESQLGAWASRQSRPIASRAELERDFAAASTRFQGRAVPRPENWGMLSFLPHAIELWLSGEHRLHDRFRYERDGDTWRVTRLAP